MRRMIQITKADLRGFLSDRRYWQPGHSEPKAFSDWVTAGWQALYAADGGQGGGSVWVRPDSRVREGHTEQVSGYWRAAPASVNGQAPGASVDQNIRPAAAGRDPVTGRPLLGQRGLPTEGGIGGGGRAGRPFGSGSNSPIPRPRSLDLPAPGRGTRAPARSPEELFGRSNPENRTSIGTEICGVDGGLAQMSDDFGGLTVGRPVSIYPNPSIPEACGSARHPMAAKHRAAEFRWSTHD